MGLSILPVCQSNLIYQPVCATVMEISIVCLPARPSVYMCVCMFCVGMEGAEHTHRHTHDPHNRTKITHAHIVVLGKIILNAVGRWLTGVTKHQVTHRLLFLLCQLDSTHHPHENRPADTHTNTHLNVLTTDSTVSAYEVWGCFSAGVCVTCLQLKNRSVYRCFIFHGWWCRRHINSQSSV